MATIQEVYEAFAAVKLREDLPGIVQENGAALAELIKGQLIQGKLATGDTIAPSYASKYYAKKKFDLNSLAGYGNPDAKLSGNLYDAIEVTEKSVDEYNIDSTVEYAHNKSIEQYGPELLTPSEDSKQEFCDNALGPAISKYITEKTGLEML